MTDYGTKKRWLERFKQALVESETDRDVESAMVNIGFSACPVGLQLIEYYEACEAYWLAIENGFGPKESGDAIVARLAEARKAFNEG